MSEIARTIFNQLGGNRFAMITGSKNFIMDDTRIAFKLAKNKMRATHLRIELDERSDTYVLTFLKFNTKTTAYDTLKKIEDVYCDMLLDIFEENTGLYATLNRRG